MPDKDFAPRCPECEELLVNGRCVACTDSAPSLAEFMPRYEKDNNEWWRLECGHHQNLFEEAVDRCEMLADAVRELGRALGDLAWEHMSDETAEMYEWVRSDR